GDFLQRLGRLANDLPEIAGLDLNPVIGRPDGCDFGFSADGSAFAPMGSGRRPTTLRVMNDVLADHVAWRRRNIRHQYVGRLEAMVDRIRFIGRAPEVGIDVALSIPFEQITRVRPAHGASEAVL